MSKELLSQIDKISTTPLGLERIKKNLEIDVEDVVHWCKQKVMKSSNITRIGKNWYVHAEDIVLTINAGSFTIITAHQAKRGTENE